MRTLPLWVLAMSLGCDAPGRLRHFEVTPAEVAETKEDRRKNPIPYLGGPILRNPRAIHLYWGVWWSTDEGLQRRALLDGLAAALGGTSYIALVTQYTDKDGMAAN